MYQCYRCLELGHTQESVRNQQSYLNAQEIIKIVSVTTDKEYLNCKSDGKPCNHCASDTRCIIFSSEMKIMGASLHPPTMANFELPK